MRRSFFSVFCALYLILGVQSFADDDVEELLKAIIKVRAKIPADAYTADSLGTEREGSGVIIDKIGHVLTIGYLIIEAEHIELIGPKGKSVTAIFIGYDFNTGFGILLPDEPLSVIPMKLGHSSEVKEGDHLFVASFGGLDSVQTARVISRMEFAGYWEYLLENAIFSSPPHPNFGGAALIGHDGCLLGIGSLYTRFSIPGVGLIPCNVFVPIDLLRPILADLIHTGLSREPPRPWLGLYAEESHGRVFVIRVTAGGPAEKAGLRPGDIVLTVNGVEISGLADFYRKVWALGNAGEDVHLGVLQGTHIRNIIVNSANRYRFLKPTAKGKMVLR